jgi:peptidoglycan biosynthesis protein MviN/MurJ (putative lipid II flippase)
MFSSLRKFSVTLWVPAVLALGALVSLARELTIANTLGDSRAADVFRIAYTLPNYFSQTIGTIIVTTAVGLIIANNEREKLQVLFRWFSISIVIFCLICVLTVGFQIDLFYPGYARDSEALLMPMRLGWLIFLICGLTLMPRAMLNVRRDAWPAASATLLRSGFFILLFYTLKSFHITLLWAALTAAVGSCFPLLVSHRKAISELFGGIAKRAGTSLSNAGVTLGAAIVFQLLASGPRFVDRYFASDYATGAISIIEYSYGLALVPVAIALNAFIIVVLPRILSPRQKREHSSAILGWSLLVFCTAALISVVLYLLPSWPRLIVDTVLTRPDAISGSNKDGLIELLGMQLAIFPITLVSLCAAHFLIARGLPWRPIIAAGLKLLVKVLIFLFVGTLSYQVFAESYLFAELSFSLTVFFFYLMSLKRVGEA